MARDNLENVFLARLPSRWSTETSRSQTHCRPALAKPKISRMRSLTGSGGKVLGAVRVENKVATLTTYNDHNTDGSGDSRLTLVPVSVHTVIRLNVHCRCKIYKIFLIFSAAVRSDVGPRVAKHVKDPVISSPK